MQDSTPHTPVQRDPDPLTIGAFLIGAAGSLAGIAAFLRDARQERRLIELELPRRRATVIRWRTAIESQRHALRDLRRALELGPETNAIRFRPKMTTSIYLSEQGFRVYRRAMKELLESTANVHDSAISVAETLGDPRIQQYILDEAAEMRGAVGRMTEDVVSGELALDGLIEACLSMADRMITICRVAEDEMR